MEEEFKKQLATKDALIKTLENSIQTLKESLTLKDDQIKTLEGSLKIKDGNIETMEKTISQKEEQLQKLTSTASISEHIVSEKEKELESVLKDKNTLQDQINRINSEITNLNKEINILNEELGKADRELEKLELENESLKKAQLEAKVPKIIDFTQVEISKNDILDKMREILNNAKHNVMICVPKIDDLQVLHLYEVRNFVNLKISCFIVPSDEDQANLVEEFLSLDNISLRNYSGEDRFSINCDGEELLLAIIGNKDDNFLAFHTKDENHIRLFSSFVMDAWLRGRKVNE
ncbi:MAG: hypothetical protein JW891_18895 [Candidatus Lokiarchaeota archaeon]|nr:hypothetical protein [Candidatus Lokiarchaeota archaeon]